MDRKEHSLKAKMYSAIVPACILIGTAIAGCSVSAKNTEESANKNLRSIKTGICAIVPVIEGHLMYPDPDEHPKVAYNMKISTTEALQFVQFLNQGGWHTITMDEMYEGLYNQRNMPDKPIVLVFDDGYKEMMNFEELVALPNNIKFTIAVISESLGTDRFPTRLSKEQIKVLMGRGNVEIVDHSFSHKDLTAFTEQELRVEFDKSLAAFEKYLGIRPSALVLPGGKSNELVRRVASERYKLIAEADPNKPYTINDCHSDPLSIQRANMEYKKIDRIEDWLMQLNK